MNTSVEDLAYQIRKKNLGDALYSVFQQFRLRVEAVARDSALDKRSIYRYISNQVAPPKKTLVQLLIGMKIPYQISWELLYAAGYVLNSSDEDVFYAAILEQHTFDVYEVNEMIDEYNSDKKRAVIKKFKL